MTEKAVAALRAQKEKILAAKNEFGWTPDQSAWHRAYGELSGINYALDLLVDTRDAVTAGKRGT